jgi:hypothetical protein
MFNITPKAMNLLKAKHMSLTRSLKLSFHGISQKNPSTIPAQNPEFLNPELRSRKRGRQRVRKTAALDPG